MALTSGIPQIWAKTALMILMQNLGFGNSVHREFSADIAERGQVINLTKIGEVSSGIKTGSGNYSYDTPSTTNQTVELSRVLYVGLKMPQFEVSLNNLDLLQEYIQPTYYALARDIDLMLMARMWSFANNFAGNLGGYTSSTIHEGWVETARVMNNNLTPAENRFMAMSYNTQALASTNSLFADADKSLDPSVQITGAIGPKYGFFNWASSIIPSISGLTTTTGAVNSVGGHATGVSTIVVDGITGTKSAGTFLKVGGALYRITSSTNTSGNTTGITLSRPLYRSVANDDVITFGDVGAVNLAAGYAAGYDGPITVDGFGTVPPVGAPISTASATGAVYGIVKRTSTTVTLDRPLEAALADDAVLVTAPNGEYNFAYHKNAVALATRPLRLPDAANKAAVVTDPFSGIGLRVVMDWDKDAGADIILTDVLLGTAIVRPEYGCVMGV